MIEGPAGPSPKRGARPGFPKFFPMGRLPFGMEGWWETLKQRMAALRRPRPDRSDVFLWRLQLVNRICWIVLAGLGCYLVFDLILRQPKPPVIAKPAPALTGAAEEAPPVMAEGAMKSLPDYHQSITQRNPFQLAVTAAAHPRR